MRACPGTLRHDAPFDLHRRSRRRRADTAPLNSPPRRARSASWLAVGGNLAERRCRIRELLLGPKRFNELGAKLQAAGPNRLTSRLRRLQGVGVVAKTASGAYVLTEFGEGLRAPVIGLCL
ncbi:winged helix-turn-helix transcriptional regulator [Nocardia sp. NPDC050630]|uniref:winged helix-turn-helix transcriptional regulator n=1 Tax=Nocardia sp. NPDC050630 TaxID=3364321 RepID=UPI00379E7D92